MRVAPAKALRKIADEYAKQIHEFISAKSHKAICEIISWTDSYRRMKPRRVYEYDVRRHFAVIKIMFTFLSTHQFYLWYTSGVAWWETIHRFLHWPWLMVNPWRRAENAKLVQYWDFQSDEVDSNLSFGQTQLYERKRMRSFILIPEVWRIKISKRIFRYRFSCAQ